MHLRNYFIRNLNADGFYERFLISAIAAILGIRFYLTLTGFPQLGGGGLHIAHMLWGGLLMLAALILLFSFLGKKAQSVSAILAGAGFGTFIDELGKFITHNNDYFFKPTIAIIYVIFIILYLIFQSLEKYRHLSKREYLINALEILKEGILGNITADDVQRAKLYIKKSQSGQKIENEFTGALAQLSVAVKKQSIFARIGNSLLSFYDTLLRKGILEIAVIIFFSLQAVVILIQAIFATVVVAAAFQTNSFSLLTPKSFLATGDVITSVLSGFFILLGILRIFGSRMSAYKMFKISVLISLFLTQFFLFYDIQFEALYDFAWTIIALVILNTLIKREKRLQN